MAMGLRLLLRSDIDVDGGITEESKVVDDDSELLGKLEELFELGGT
jgi:hypothetical protein